MISIDRLERRFGWLAFPAFLRYYALFHVLAYGLHLFRPDMAALMEFDRAKIAAGQVWRVVTFLFGSSASVGSGALGVLAMVFLVLVAFMINDALEDAWGVFRTSLYHYTSMLGLVAANFLLPGVMEGSGYLFYGAAFFAFATLYPRVEFLLLMFLPIQVRWLALIQALGLIFGCFGDWRMVPFLILAHLGYLGFAGVPALLAMRAQRGAMARVVPMRRRAAPEVEAFHECSVCGCTEHTEPEAEFRMGHDGREYCDDHLPKS